MEQLLVIASEQGFSASLVVAFVWFFYKQYDRLSKRLSSVEDFHKTTLLAIIKENQEALSRNSDILASCDRLQPRGSRK